MAEPSGLDLSDIQTRYPFALDYTDDAIISLAPDIILETDDDVSEAQFGDLRNRAVTALALHKLLIQVRSQDGNQSGTQVVSQFGAGSVSTTYVSPPPSGLSYESLQFYTTQAGIDYMELAKRIGTGVRVV